MQLLKWSNPYRQGGLLEPIYEPLEDTNQPNPEPPTKKSLKKPVPQRTTYTEASRQNRLEHLAQQTGLHLTQLHSMRLNPADLRGNIECLIGTVEIPIGAAGPLLIKGSRWENEVYAPIATTEGALVSSINRGCRALQLSGGVVARTLKQRMVRAPFFDCGSLINCLTLRDWLQQRQGEIQRQVRKYSNHAVLLQPEYRVVGPCLHVRFIYETGDASGQNMTTICTWNTCQWIRHQFEAEHPGVIQNFMIDGNLSTDKKASYLSAISGRGFEVVAEALVPDAVIRRVLQSSAEDMARFFVQCQSTGVLTGVHGLNINAANVVAAIFTATGQDIACVHESSTAQLHFEKRDGGLYASILMPSLVIGSVGGGTGLPIQKQLLELINGYGPHKSSQLAETIAAYVLALELSTGAALAGGQFSSAHERLGRNKASHWLKKEDLNTTLFNHLLRTPEEWGPVIKVKPISVCNKSESLVMDLTTNISRRLCGLWGFELSHAQCLGPSKVFLKTKVSDQELLLATEIMAGVSSPGLGELLREHRADSPFNHFHVREIKLAELPDLADVMPKTLGTMINERREIYMLAQEYLEGLELFGAVESRSAWTKYHLEAAIDGIARVHARYLNETNFFQQQRWMFTFDQARVQRLAPAHFELARHLKAGGYEWFSDEDLSFHCRHLETLSSIYAELQQMPQTLIHNDFNPRNMGFRRRPHGLQLVAYDWELATVHIPQRDVVELLAFTLKETTSKEEMLFYINRHREQVQQHASLQLDKDQWLRGFTFALLDLLLQRFPIYSIAQTFRQVPFLKPSYRVARHMFDELAKGSLM